MITLYLDFHVVGCLEELWYSGWRGRGRGSVGVRLAVESSGDGLLLLHPEAAHRDLGGGDGLEGGLLLLPPGLLHEVPVLLLLLQLGQPREGVLQPLLRVFQFFPQPVIFILQYM